MRERQWICRCFSSSIPDFVKDPNMKGIETVTLNYTFFSECRSPIILEETMVADGAFRSKIVTRTDSSLRCQLFNISL